MKPSPEAQLVFLSKLQRLFAEGDFTATYKFALLIALADLAVELGDDSGAALELGHRGIAAKFIELYWQQSAPYSTGRSGTSHSVLVQNSGTQAAIITAVAEFRQNNLAATVQSARSLTSYQALILRVGQTVSAQPINYLQNLGGGTDPFLYERVRGAIILKPGGATPTRCPAVDRLGSNQMPTSLSMKPTWIVWDNTRCCQPHWRFWSTC